MPFPVFFMPFSRFCTKVVNLVNHINSLVLPALICSLFSISTSTMIAQEIFFKESLSLSNLQAANLVSPPIHKVSLCILWILLALNISLYKIAGRCAKHSVHPGRKIWPLVQGDMKKPLYRERRRAGKEETSHWQLGFGNSFASTAKSSSRTPLRKLTV